MCEEESLEIIKNIISFLPPPLSPMSYHESINSINYYEHIQVNIKRHLIVSYDFLQPRYLIHSFIPLMLSYFYTFFHPPTYFALLKKINFMIQQRRGMNRDDDELHFSEISMHLIVTIKWNAWNFKLIEEHKFDLWCNFPRKGQLCNLLRRFPCERNNWGRTKCLQ